jgi:membrane fusion protein (multidrug efflux system)
MDDQTIDRQRTAPVPVTRSRSGRLKRVMGFVIGAGVLVAVVAAGALYGLNARHYESTDDAFIDANTTQMASRVSGQVTALLFQDNQHVAAGQVLLTIDPRDFQAKLDQAQAQQASAEASLDQARAQVLVQAANLDQARANVIVAQSDLVQARQDYERFQAVNPRAVTRQQIDASTASFHAAQARLQASQQMVNGAQAQVHAAEAQVLAAQAQIRQAAANTEAARLQLSYCTIAAPVAGIVTHRTADTGNYVAQGQPLFALVQDGRWVTANFKETQLAYIRPGQAVDLSIDAVPSGVFHGKVDSFQAGTGSAFSTLPAENATGNYVKIVQRLPVKIVIEDGRLREYPLAPGMSVVPEVRVR